MQVPRNEARFANGSRPIQGVGPGLVPVTGRPGAGAPSLTVWRRKDLPGVQTGSVGVPLRKGVTGVLFTAILSIPAALATEYAARNAVAAGLVRAVALVRGGGR